MSVAERQPIGYFREALEERRTNSTISVVEGTDQHNRDVSIGGGYGQERSQSSRMSESDLDTGVKHLLNVIQAQAQISPGF